MRVVHFAKRLFFHYIFLSIYRLITRLCKVFVAFFLSFNHSNMEGLGFHKQQGLREDSSKKMFFITICITLLISCFSYYVLPLFPFQSIAHRGASSYAPENTMSAFDKAVELEFDYIEVDVRMSRDFELVVIHDEVVDRTTNGKGKVQDLTVSQLKQLDAGSWYSPKFAGEKIPLLHEVLDEYGSKIGILIDVKSAEDEVTMINLLSKLVTSSVQEGLNAKNLKIQSFHVNEIKMFHELNPNISTGILLSKSLDLFHLASYRKFTSFLSVHHRILSKSFIRQAKLFDYEIFTWTIKYQDQFKTMQKLKVQGIISDEELKNEGKTLIFFTHPLLNQQ